MEEPTTTAIDRPLVCLDGSAHPEKDVELPRGMSFTATDRLEFLKASEEIRKASVKPGLSAGGRLALRFLSQQTRRLARAPG